MPAGKKRGYMFMIYVQEKSHHDQMVSSLASKHPEVN